MQTTDIKAGWFLTADGKWDSARMAADVRSRIPAAMREVTADEFWAALKATPRDIMPSAIREAGRYHSLWGDTRLYGHRWGWSMVVEDYSQHPMPKIYALRR